MKSLLNGRLPIWFTWFRMRLLTSWDRGGHLRERLEGFAEQLLRQEPDIEQACVFFGYHDAQSEYGAWHVVGQLKGGEPFCVILPVHSTASLPPILIKKAKYDRIHISHWENDVSGGLIAVHRQKRGKALVNIAKSALTADASVLSAHLDAFGKGLNCAMTDWRMACHEAERYQDLGRQAG